MKQQQNKKRGSVDSRTFKGKKHVCHFFVPTHSLGFQEQQTGKELSCVEPKAPSTSFFGDTRVHF